LDTYIKLENKMAQYTSLPWSRNLDKLAIEGRKQGKMIFLRTLIKTLTWLIF